MKHDNDYVDSIIKETDSNRVGNYINNCTPIVFFCKPCNKEFSSILINIKNRIKDNLSPCPICNNRNRRLNNKVIDDRLCGTGIHRCGEYITANVAIEWMDETGYRWKDTPANVISKYKKNGKNNHVRLNNSIIDDRLKDRKIKRVGDYINASTPIEWMCLETGDTWKCLPNNIFRGYGNPNLRTHKREKDILNYLKNNKIEFSYHFTFRDITCKYIVDFYIPQINTIIEYNGKQHYVPVEYFGGEKRFNTQKNRDEKLRNFCITKDIKLVEIPYSLSWQRIVDTLDSVMKGG